MPASRIISNDEIRERTQATLGLTFRDNDGNVLTGCDFCEFTLYLRDSPTTIINSRDGVDVLSSVTSGVLSLTLTALDNVMVSTTAKRERHIAHFDFGQGGVTNWIEASLLIVASPQVP